MHADSRNNAHVEPVAPQGQERMYLLHLDHRFPSFRDRKCQHNLALLDALPPRLLVRHLRDVPSQNISLHTDLPIIYTHQRDKIITRAILAVYLQRTMARGAGYSDDKGAELA